MRYRWQHGTTMKHRTYRVEWERWLNVAISGAFAIFCVFKVDDGRNGPGSASPSARAIGYVIVAIACVLVIRSIRIAIVTTREHMIVRGIFVTRRFSLGEIDNVAMGRGQAVLRLRDGRTVRLWHLQRANPAFVRGIQAADRIVDELNLDLAARRGVVVPPAEPAAAMGPSRSTERPPSVARRGMRTAAVLLAQLILGVVIGVVLVSSGERVGGWLIIAASVVGPLAVLIAYRRAIRRLEQHGNHGSVANGS